MIHYNHNTGKHKNIRLQKAKRHAYAHYRHMQRMAALRDTLARSAIVAALMIVLAVAYLIGTN